MHFCKYPCPNYFFNSRCFIKTVSCTFWICLDFHSRQDKRREMQSTFSLKPFGMFHFSFMKTRSIHLITLTLLSVNDSELLASRILTNVKEAFRSEKLLMAMWALRHSSGLPCDSEGISTLRSPLLFPLTTICIYSLYKQAT